MNRTLIALTALTPLVLGACGSSGTSSRTVRLGEKQDGSTVRVHRGETVELRLHSTYWQVPPPNGDVLAVTSRNVHGYPPGQHCVPGGGCGTVTVRFRADHAGRTVISAGRRTCGEAMRCTGDSGTFAVTVVVT